MKITTRLALGLGLLFLGLGFSPRAFCQSDPGATQDKPPMPTYIEEFFLSDAVRSEDQGEWQFTLTSDSRESFGASLGLEVEYGITRRLQLEFELPYGVSSTQNSEIAEGWSTASLGVQYQIIRSDSPFALSIGVAYDIPVKGSANGGLEPTVLVAKSFRKLQVHASFLAEIEQWKPSLEYNVAGVYPVRGHWFPTFEFNGRRFDSKNAFYLTPGLYRHLDHRLEIGIGVPIGTGGAAAPVGLVSKVTWEIGGDKDNALEP